MSSVLRSTVAAMLWIGWAGAAAAERIYILSQDGAVLSEVAPGAEAPADGAVIKLEKGPALLALAPDAPLAYVTHSDLGQVAVVDLDRRRVVRMIEVPGSPFGIAAGKGGRIFVGDWHQDHVIAVDTAGDGEPTLTKVKVGRAPAHVVLSPDGETVFVANREDDSVSAVRTSDMTVAATIPVGHAPFAMTLSPDGARLFVGNMQGGSVSVVDTAKLAVTDTWKTGAMPYGAAVTPDGTRVLITHQGGGTVGIFAETDTALATVKVGSYPEGVAIGENGKRAYVANWFSDNVSVIDLESMKEVQRIKTPAGPRAVVVRAAP
ncbi:protein MxaE [Hyphomicrobium nitrativorans NL23]|uniref:Protein MxaE n=1 Tax=Hyphomicrobium nitrativorans NL23 TaxID=1029756 RepID=V5SEQ2_9HYPH|nr:YncE family protein [Hyphomicrobium nitrativorans]AHB49336.1 protein MxaE [Hyphomicrobium nitrativorans NL23]